RLGGEAAEVAHLGRPEHLHPLGVHLLGVAGERQPRLLDARHRDPARQAGAAGEETERQAGVRISRELLDLDGEHGSKRNVARDQYFASSSAMTLYMSFAESAARSRVRNSGSLNSRLMRARAFKWTPVEFSGATSTKKRCVGRPSMESKSMPSRARPTQATSLPTASSLPCGMATPSPMAVDARRSRSTSTFSSASRETPSLCLAR